MTWAKGDAALVARGGRPVDGGEEGDVTPDVVAEGLGGAGVSAYIGAMRSCCIAPIAP